MFKLVRAVRFLFIGPFLLVVLTIINVMTTPGHWWVLWAALGIGVAWIASLLRVIQSLIVLGGLAALLAYMRKKSWQNEGGYGPGGRRFI